MRPCEWSGRGDPAGETGGRWASVRGVHAAAGENPAPTGLRREEGWSSGTAPGGLRASDDVWRPRGLSPPCAGWWLRRRRSCRPGVYTPWGGEWPFLTSSRRKLSPRLMRPREALLWAGGRWPSLKSGEETVAPVSGAKVVTVGANGTAGRRRRCGVTGTRPLSASQECRGQRCAGRRAGRV